MSAMISTLIPSAASKIPPSGPPSTPTSPLLRADSELALVSSVLVPTMAGIAARRAGTAMDVDLLRHERLTAFGEHHDRIEILTAEIVGVQQRPPLLPGHVDIAPVDDRHDDRVEVEPFRRQAILITRRPLLVGHFGEHELVDKLLQATGKDRSGDAETLLEILEPPNAQETVP